MWRINNIMLAVVLAGAILVGGFRAYEELSWQFDYRQNASDRETRTLTATRSTDESGRTLRTQSVSFNQVVEADEWGGWSLVVVQQTGSKAPQPVDEIVVTGSRRGGLGAPAPSFVSTMNVSYANNIVVRNEGAKSESILFSEKVAISSLLPVIGEDAPGVVVVYGDEDSNEDGKIDTSDQKKLRRFRFDGGSSEDIVFEGLFYSLESYEPGASVFRFTTYIDADDSGSPDFNFEPVKLYEVSIASGVVSKALSDDTETRLQAILDNTPSASN
ncbi:MAG: hypothetical protein RIC52_15115 [Amphiplicatus sp.]